MTLLLNSVVQVAVILSVALTALLPLRKKSAALRHAVLSTAIVFSILTPALNLVMSVWNSSALVTIVSRHPAVVPIREQIAAMTSPTQVRAQRESVPNAGAEAVPPGWVMERSHLTGKLPWMIWVGGVVAGLIVLFTGLVRLAGVVSRSVPMPNGSWRQLAAGISSEYRLTRVVHLLESRNASVLVTWGVFQPRIVLPAGSTEWPEDRARIVLRHELAHVRRRDWIVQMAAQTLRIIYWFNPLVWIVCRRLRLESECACDDAVLADNIEGHEYAEHLLNLARLLNTHGQSWSAALTMARASTIERRFSAMLNPELNRYPLTRFALLATMFIGLVVALSLSAASTASPIYPTVERPAPALVAQPEGAPAIAVPSPIPASQPRSIAKPQPPTVQNFPPATTLQRRRAGALDRALFEVAEEGEVSDIDELLRAGANVNAVIQGDGTPLMAAAGEGRLDAVRYLLDRGADPNLPAPGDGNPLIVAAREGHIDVVLLLLDRGADPNAAVSGDGNPLIAAAHEGRASVVALLLDRGAHIDQIVPGDENALIQASAEGHLNVVRLLVERRADVNARVWIEANPWRPNGEWRTPLSVARREGHERVVQFLLSVGAKE
jgi:beta-lactamase regulating signal transducer with metallopeptidase domain